MELFLRNFALSLSNTLIPVPILCIDKNISNGLFTKSIGNVFDLSKLSFEFKIGHSKPSKSINAYKYKRNFDIVTYSNTNKDLDSIFLDFVFLFVKPNGYVLLDRILPNKKPIKSFEIWNVYKMDSTDKYKSSSQIIYQYISTTCDLITSDYTYYSTSEEREEEVREAYKTDSEFIITNITSAIHACILQSMFPNMRFIVKLSKIQKDETLITKVLDVMGQVYFIK